MPDIVDIFDEGEKKSRKRDANRRRTFTAPEPVKTTDTRARTEPEPPQTVLLTGAQGGKKGLTRSRVAAAVIALALVAGAGGFALLGQAPVGDVVADAPAEVIPTVSEPTPSPSETPDGAADTEGSTQEPQPIATPVVDTVTQTLVIEYAPTEADLTAQDRESLRALAESLAPGEQIAVTGYAGFSATDEWADYIAPQRAETVRNYLTSLGATDILDLAQGTEPAINTAAGDIIAADGIDHNRLVVVTAVTLLPAQE